MPLNQAVVPKMIGRRVSVWSLAGLVVGSSLALLTIVQCGGTPASQAKPPQKIEPGPWQVVDDDVNRSLGGHNIYHQGPRPPKLEYRAPVEVPSAHAGSLPSVAIAEIVISPDGKIARARILRAPDFAGLTNAVVTSLRKWRFQPARLEGKPVAVYYTVTVPLVEKNADGMFMR